MLAPLFEKPEFEQMQMEVGEALPHHGERSGT